MRKRSKLFRTVKHGRARGRRLLLSLAVRHVDCPKEKYGTSYGGWTICPAHVDCDSIVYSFGIGEDISFDLSVIKTFGAQVYAFDPTPRSVKWIRSQRLPDAFKWFDFGIADYDGTAELYPPQDPSFVSYSILPRSASDVHPVEATVHRLSTILHMLGHWKVDILKMDIEGAEYAVIADIIRSGVNVHQLLVEFHHHFDSIRVSRTLSAIRLLTRNGYQTFNISESGREYSFIHGDQT